MPNLVSVKFIFLFIHRLQVVAEVPIQVEAIFLRTPKKIYFVLDRVFAFLYIRHILRKAIEIILNKAIEIILKILLSAIGTPSFMDISEIEA
mgnify:CR=1 FL=1